MVAVNLSSFLFSFVQFFLSINHDILMKHRAKSYLFQIELIQIHLLKIELFQLDPLTNKPFPFGYFFEKKQNVLKLI